jgi:hypothetical protein
MQTIPCEYEQVMVQDYVIRVEEMGRVATYNMFGRLKEEFKPGRI